MSTRYGSSVQPSVSLGSDGHGAVPDGKPSHPFTIFGYPTRAERGPTRVFVVSLDPISTLTCSKQNSPGDVSQEVEVAPIGYLEDNRLHPAVLISAPAGIDKTIPEALYESVIQTSFRAGTRSKLSDCVQKDDIRGFVDEVKTQIGHLLSRFVSQGWKTSDELKEQGPAREWLQNRENLGDLWTANSPTAFITTSESQLRNLRERS
ncbi:hypothetical protein DB88DRAFT_344416 [Papiliotrema laurentii]|uniref:Uncharacterized protein n=1 Tax=Papiliotrema laurentii TaxID=5418 RepID=A0AAD9CYU8_PAPLA|nr:hypothetical protein DB88DRAFT_344416 [Papiliotrema laurentii]